MKSSTALAGALAQLEIDRAAIAAELGRFDAAIGAIRNCLGTTSAPAPTRPDAAGPSRVAAPVSRATAGRRGALLAALSQGPVSPGALAVVLDITRHQLRVLASRLEAEGAIVAVGSTASRRLALPGRPAKEEP